MDTYTHGSYIIKLHCIISIEDDMGRAAQLAASAAAKLLSGFDPSKVSTVPQNVDGFHKFPSGSWAAILSGNCSHSVIFSRVPSSKLH